MRIGKDSAGGSNDLVFTQSKGKSMQMIKVAVAAAMLSVAAGQAFAITQADIPAQPPAIPAGGLNLNLTGDGAGPVLVAVWDINTGSSLVQWLGLNYNQVSSAELDGHGVLD